MRSALLAAMVAAGVSSFGLTSVLAHALRPTLPKLVTPITMVDDGLGVAGVDISKAGQSKQSRMTYLNSLVQDTQGNVRARCGQVLDSSDAASGVTAFCKDVLPGR
jgi:hypothetical protein